MDIRIVRLLGYLRNILEDKILTETATKEDAKVFSSVNKLLAEYLIEKNFKR